MQQRSQSVSFSKYGALMDVALHLVDLCIASGASLISWWLRFGNVAIPHQYKFGIFVVLLLTLIVFQASGIYRSWRGEEFPAEIVRVWATWCLVFAIFVMLLWMFKSTAQYSRLWLGTWFLSATALFAGSRWLARAALGVIRERGIDSRSVVIIGATTGAAHLVKALARDAWSGLQIVGFVSTPFDKEVKAFDELPCLGTIESYLSEAKDSLPDQIWLALPLRAESLIQRCLDELQDSPITLRFIPDFLGYELLNHHVTELVGIPVLTLRGTPMEGHARLLKAAEDRFLAALFLVVLSPLMLLIALGVKLSSRGPVLYRQKRHGLGGREIYVVKFRTMRQHQTENGSVPQATRDDCRITWFGRFLRRSSFDELPQFINVLRGEMSIVGPRPHAIEHNEFYSKKLRGYMQRHGVKPGITGWAQVNGLRGETDTVEKMAKRVEHDIYYINNWSIWLDLKIILMTPLAILARTNAY